MSVAAKGPTTQELRAQLSIERKQLTDALEDLREGVHSARRIPIIIGGALLAGLATVGAVKFVRNRGD